MASGFLAPLADDDLSVDVGAPEASKGMRWNKALADKSYTKGTFIVVSSAKKTVGTRNLDNAQVGWNRSKPAERDIVYVLQPREYRIAGSWPDVLSALSTGLGISQQALLAQLGTNAIVATRDNYNTDLVQRAIQREVDRVAGIKDRKRARNVAALNSVLSVYTYLNGLTGKGSRKEGAAYTVSVRTSKGVSNTSKKSKAAASYPVLEDRWQDLLRTIVGNDVTKAGYLDLSDYNGQSGRGSAILGSGSKHAGKFFYGGSTRNPILARIVSDKSASYDLGLDRLARIWSTPENLASSGLTAAEITNEVAAAKASVADQILAYERDQRAAVAKQQQASSSSTMMAPMVSTQLPTLAGVGLPAVSSPASSVAPVSLSGGGGLIPTLAAFPGANSALPSAATGGVLPGMGLGGI